MVDGPLRQRNCKTSLGMCKHTSHFKDRQRGFTRMEKKASTADPVRKYIDKKGVHRYAGTSSLRKTELLGVNPFYSIVEYNVMFVF